MSGLVLVLFALIAGATALAFGRPASVIRHARAVLVSIGFGAALALVGLIDVGTGHPRIRLDASEEPLMVGEDPERGVYDTATRRFGRDDQVLVVLAAPSVWEEQTLTTLREAADRLADLPHVRRVEGLVNTPDYRFDTEWGGIRFRELIENVPDAADEREALRQRVLEDPVYPKLWVAPDGRMSALLISFAPVTDQELIDSGFHERLEGELARLAVAETRWHVTGRPHIKARAIDVMVRDLSRLIPLAVAIATLVVLLFTRSVVGAALPLANAILASVVTFAVMSRAQVPINLITLVLGPTLISLGGLYGVHVVSLHTLGERADCPKARALATLCRVRLPILLAGVSTCVGFFALMVTGVPATRELGFFGAFGMATLTLLSLTGLPAALALLPDRALPLRSEAQAELLDRALATTGRWVTAHSGAIIAAFGLTTVAAAAILPRVIVDTDYLSFFDRKATVRTDYRAIADGLIGPTPLYLVFEGESEGAFRSPTTLRSLDALARELEALPAISAVFSMVEPVRKLNRALAHPKPDSLRIPDTREEVSDALFLIPKRELRRFATSNHRAANLVLHTDRLGSRELRALRADIGQVLAQSAHAANLPTAQLTGNALVLNRSADFVAGDQVRAIGAAACAIFLLVGVVFRSWRAACIAMVPNLVPVILFFGVLAMGFASLSFPTGLIGCLTLGVALDDTLHFLSHYRRERRSGLAPAAAAERSLARVGRAIVITTVMLVAGFGSILVSGFATIREFGALTATVMGLCLATDLLLFPALLIRFRI